MPKNTWIEGQPSPYQSGDNTHFPDWHNMIVWDAFFNNLTAGLMIVTTIVWFFGAMPFMAVLPFALTLALILLVIDLGLLIFDLGDPWRFPHSLRVMRFTSSLSVGVWGLTSYAIFLVLTVILAWIFLLIGPQDGLGYNFALVLARLFAVMAAIGATVVILYKGVVFSCSAQPGVKDARWLTSFMISDSLLMGLSLYILVALSIFPDLVLQLIVPFITLIIARAITFALVWQDVKDRAKKVNGSENRTVFWTVYGAGGVLALILAPWGFAALALAAILNISCGVVERYWLISLPRPYNAPQN